MAIRKAFWSGLGLVIVTTASCTAILDIPDYHLHDADGGHAGGGGGGTSATSSSSATAGTGGVSGCSDNMQNGNETDVDCGGLCPKCGNGKTCSASTDCQSGTCVDGVCCLTATCTGLCKSCNQGVTAAGVPGTCDFIAANMDPDNECATECNSAGACEAANGAACTQPFQCQSGNCVDGFCCDTACNGTCQACSNALTGMANGTCASLPALTDPENECTGAQVCGAVGTCVPGPNGTVCGVAGMDSNCTSKHCVDGFCCDYICVGLCRSCSGTKSGGFDGTCTYIYAGADPDNECSGATPYCNGSGMCGP